jgi:uncharacterized LabA/DUF88 family protein
MSITYGGVGTAYTGPKEIQYLFIDGACLRTILDDYSQIYFGGETMDLNFAQFTGHFSKVFYYDSTPGQKHKESNADYEARMPPIMRQFDALAMLDRFHVSLGSSYLRNKVLHQKKVDIMIATDMLTHTFHKHMHGSTLLASDLDFKPLVDALVQNGMDVTLWYGDTKNCRTSKEFLTSADRRIKLSIQQLYHNSSPAFKKRFGIPIVHRDALFDKTFNNLINSWTDPGVGKVSLYHDADLFSLVYHDPESKEYKTYIEFKDLTILQIFAKEEIGITVPAS